MQSGGSGQSSPPEITWTARELTPSMRGAGRPSKRDGAAAVGGGDRAAARSGAERKGCRAQGLRHTRTKPRHAWTNGFVKSDPRHDAPAPSATDQYRATGATDHFGMSRFEYSSFIFRPYWSRPNCIARWRAASPMRRRRSLSAVNCAT